MRKHLVLLSALLLQVLYVSVFAQPPVSWEEYEPLDSRDVKEKAGWNHLDISINTTDPGIPRTIHTNRGPVIQHEYVDLGLSVKWATCNVGASKPEEAGCRYAWGELDEKENYTVENYKYYEADEYHHINKYNSNSFDGKDGFTDDKMILDPEDDVAHVKWGGDWRIPTAEEWEELMEGCNWKWVEVDGIGGYRITGKKPGYKDRSIFLPASGIYGRLENEFDLYGKIGDYWSSSRSTESFYRPASSFFFNSHEYLKSATSRHLPKSIRPVCPSDSKVSLTQLSADMRANVKAYMPDPGELEEYEYIIEIKPSSYDVNIDSKDNKIFQVPEGITLKELIARLPGVETDKDGSLITESRKDIVTSIEFNGGKVYPENTTSGYPDDYKLNSGAIHVVIMDRKHFRKYLSKTYRDDLPKNRAEISISHYPRQNADDLLYVILRGRRESLQYKRW